MMHERGKSDTAVGAKNPANKAERSAAELVEQRAVTKGNADQQSTRRAQERESVSQALGRIRQAAKQRKKETFTTLFHHISVELLRLSFFEIKKDAAPGVDGLTWQDYEAGLDRNIEDLHDRVHRGAYRAQPSRRLYIPKPDGRQRPIAIAALEDKIVQRATAAVLNTIYEEDFLGFSYGFRPKRSQHDALDALVVGISSTKVNWILEVDVRSFFDEVSQSWLTRFLEHRIADPRILHLIQKWLKAGILEDGVVTVSDKGTGQGSVISPLLANIYLHYSLDLWAERWRRREATGDMIMVRYADDVVLGFEHETDARRFWDAMRDRLQGFSLSLHPEKTRLIEFGRHAANQPQAARARQTGDLQFPWHDLHLRQVARGQIPSQAEDPSRPHAGEDQGGCRGTATADASVDTRTGQMAEASHHRLLQLPRGTNQLGCAGSLSSRDHRTLAPDTQPTQPKGQSHLGSNGEAG